MPTRAEVAQIARERLGGALSRFGFREWGLLARLLTPDEEVEAMVYTRLAGGGLVGSQRIVVATPRRLLLVEKGFVTGRERIREVAWTDVRKATLVPPFKLVLELPGERLELQFGHPPRELGTLAEVARAHAGQERPHPSVTGELLDLARGRLGRRLGAAAEPQVLALVGELGPDEEVLDLAWAAGSPQGLLAATTAQVVFLPARRLGVGPVTRFAYPVLQRAEADGEDLVFADVEGRELRCRWVGPGERGAVVLERVRARMRG